MARSVKNILPKTFLAINFAGKRVVFQSKRNLAKKRRRRMGSGRFVTSRTDNTGRLSSSIKFKSAGQNSFFEMLYYGLFIDSGRKAGKYAPVDAINDWVKTKPVVPRDERGRFMKRTPKTMKSLAFLLNRALFKYGIEPTYFFTNPLEAEVKKLEDKLPDVVAEDIEIYFTNEL